jgi:PAS domain S-box-containing protein
MLKRSARLRHTWVPYCVLGLTLLLTFVAFLTAHRLDATRDQARFANAVEQVQENLQRQLNAYLVILDGVRGLATAKVSLSREQFYAYADSLQLRQTYPGVQGLGFASRLLPEQKTKAIEKMRTQGDPTFRIWPNSTQAESYPIVYLAPFDNVNKPEIGFDMYSEGTRRAAITRAITSAQATASGNVIFASAIGGRPSRGFLIYIPVYWGGTAPATVPERVRTVFGLVFCPLRADDIFKLIANSHGSAAVGFRVYDGRVLDAGHLLFDSTRDAPGRLGAREFTSTNTVLVADRTWTIVYSAPSEFAAEGSISSAPLVLVAGVLISFLLFGITWTQARAHEAAERHTGMLLTAETKFRRLIEQSLTGIYVIQGDRFVYVNPKMTEIFGYAAEELTARSVFDFIVPNEHAAARENIQKPLQGAVESNHYALHMIRKDGRVIEVEIHGGRAEYNDRPSILGTLLDATDRKQAERRLAMQHSVTLALAEAATFEEAATRILEQTCRRFGWKLGQLWTVERHSDALRCTAAWHPPSTEFMEFQTLSRNVSFRRGSGLPGRVWDSGTAAWMANVSDDPDFLRAKAAKAAGLRGAICFPVRLRANVLGVMEFFTDEPVGHDADLLELFNALGPQIGQSMERKQIEDQLRHSQKMEAVGQLASGVAHDFNNILMVINGYSQMLLEAPDVSSDQAKLLKEIHTAGERAGKLTNQLLAFSRKQPMRLVASDLNEIVRDVAKMLRRLIGENITLRMNMAPNVPPVLVDAGMIQQILLNLSVNARDAMPKGGQLAIATRLETIDDATAARWPDARAGDFACLVVEDTGCGMPPQVLNHIFEPFFTTKEAGKGTGLGLATVFGIVKQHEGWIDVVSAADAGTTFKIFLPITTEAAARSRGSAPTGLVGGKEIVLLVEDEEAVRGLAALVLQRYGYGVLEAASGPQALELWERHAAEIDLMLSDMVMPGGITGRELAEKFRSTRPDLKVILMSGYSAEMSGRAFAWDEKTPFLQKPFEAARLIATVRQCLDEKATG